MTTRLPHPDWELESFDWRLQFDNSLPLIVFPSHDLMGWKWCAQDALVRGSAATADEAKLAAEDAMIAHARKVIEQLSACRAETKAPKCLSQSPGDPNDENDPPVTCTREKGHKGKHAGGTRGGSLEW